jgi:hypothetical protein
MGVQVGGQIGVQVRAQTVGEAPSIAKKRDQVNASSSMTWGWMRNMRKANLKGVSGSGRHVTSISLPH